MINYYNSKGNISPDPSPVLVLTLNGFGIVKNNMTTLLVVLSASVVVLIIIGFSIFKFLEKEKAKNSKEIIKWEE
ncbi:MAG: hypothetical protein KFW07_01210 [Mycoplasmataceae bacterium]|nr:hypothetical protein [Mycoplasmataceae bacterium]